MGPRGSARSRPRATKEGSTVVRSGVRFEHDGGTRVCDLVVVPVTSPPESRETVLGVLFDEARAATSTTSTDGAMVVEPAAVLDATERQHLSDLENELRTTRDYLQSLIEEHQRGRETLQATNEELLSSNEELQSLNEELQTAKEELQSTNEELSTLNEELQRRNGESVEVNSDLMNILSSVEVPIVIVDRDRRIRRFTPKARPILSLLPADVGRPIDDIKPNLIIAELDQKIAEVIDRVLPHEEEVRDRDGRWFRLQIRPYTTIEKKIDGAILSLVDVDALKRALSAAEWARDYARATVEAIQLPLLVLDARLTIVSTNRAFDHHFEVPRALSEGHSILGILGGAFSDPTVKATFELALLGAPFSRIELKPALPGLGTRSLVLSGGPVPTPGAERMLLVCIEDVTDQRSNEEERERLLQEAETSRATADDANRTKDAFLATLSHELRTPLSTLLLQAQLLRRGTVDEERLLQASAVIERATKTQAQLIDDLLDVSRIESGKMTMELRAVDLGSVVRAAIEMVSPSAEKNTWPSRSPSTARSRRSRGTRPACNRSSRTSSRTPSSSPSAGRSSSASARRREAPRFA